MTFYFSPPYRIPMVDTRADMYGVTGTPTSVFDGQNKIVGGGGSTMYGAYQPVVQSRLGVPSPLAMSSTYVMIGDEIIFDTTIDVETTIGSGDRNLYILVCIDGAHDQQNLVMDALPTEDFTLTTAGQSTTFQRSFTMAPGWNEPDLALVLFVQDMTTGEIIQATKAKPDYAATINIASVPAGVNAGWHLLGPDTEMSGNGALQVNRFQAGTFHLSWEDLPYWTEPAQNPMIVTVEEDGTIDFTGVYTDGPFLVGAQAPLQDPGAGQAVNLVDYDGDGDLDAHVVNAGSADRLLRNDAGTFVDATTGLIADAGAGRGAAWGDFTGDGLLDVFLPRHGEANVLLAGDGAGNFSVPVTYGLEAVGPSTAATWADYDLDGNLDLYVVNHGDPNVLLKNSGNLGGIYIFQDQSTGVAEAGNGNAACWVDCDLDGRPDLYVVNQFNPNKLYQNTPIGFSDMTNTSGLGETGKGLGVAWGDYDNDGDLDVYLANEGTADALYRNTGPFLFAQVSGENMGDMGNGRGVAWVDLNNDMYLDLYVVRYQEPDLMLIGDGTGSFYRVPVGPDEANGNGNGLACGDLDGDGAPDVYISRDGQTNVLFTNDLGEDNHWLKVALVGAAPNTSAIGARVVATAGGVSQTRMVHAGTGYLAATPFEMHFGLGSNTMVDRIDVVWPDGTQQTFRSFMADERYVLTQGQSAVSGVGETVQSVRTMLGAAYPNPFNPMTTIEFALARDGAARLEVYALDGRLVRTLKDEVFTAGPHRATWDGTDAAGRRVASGTYFYRLTAAGGFEDTGRMVLVK